MRFLTRAEQIAHYLRNELANERWLGHMPGRMELAAELGLNARTVEDALRILERDGILLSQGAGRRRKIASPKFNTQRQMTFGWMMYEQSDRRIPLNVDLLHRLEDAGHHVVIPEKSLTDLRMDLKRVAEQVRMHPNVQAWIILGGAYDILNWFSKCGLPVISIFGRFNELPIAAAAVRKIPALKKALKRLHELGHRRIVMLSREERRKPFPAPFEQAFLDELRALGVETGAYHLPDWANNPGAFHECLDALFKYTPPTALLLAESHLFVAAQQHLARMGIVAPRDVSMICDDPDMAFSWCDPPVSHISWDSRPIVSRVMRWADRTARKVTDHRQRFTHAQFVEGGTIGPAPK